jgi:hypothetical protein
MPFSAITKLRESVTPEVPGSVGTKPPGPDQGTPHPTHELCHSGTPEVTNSRTHQPPESVTTEVTESGSNGRLKTAPAHVHTHINSVYEGA